LSKARFLQFRMRVSEVAFWFLGVCGALAYLLPLALWIKRKSGFRAELFAIPALVIGSWLLAGAFDFAHVGNFGFTFYGALPAAVVSNLLILAFLRFRIFQGNRLHWGALVAAVCIVAGFSLYVLLPSMGE
jgi:ribose/xylose/arabinose/galactoside ABC-type transport system permease subunit